MAGITTPMRKSALILSYLPPTPLDDYSFNLDTNASYLFGTKLLVSKKMLGSSLPQIT